MPQVLLAATISVCESKYPKQRLHIYLSFDDDAISPLYLKTLQNLQVPSIPDNNYPYTMDIQFRGVRFTLSRFPHSGKRLTQRSTFDLIEQHYVKEIAYVMETPFYMQKDPIFLLFLDSDIILDSLAIQEFVLHMMKPGVDRVAVTGLITCSTSDHFNPLWVLQDIEYIQGQMLERCLESFCG